MKEKDLENDVVESPEPFHRFDLPLGRDVRLMAIVYGDPDRTAFDRWHEAINYIETAMLGPRSQPNLKPVVQHKTLKQKNWKLRKCELHPDSPRTKRNACLQCMRNSFKARDEKRRKKKQEKLNESARNAGKDNVVEFGSTD